MYGFGRLTVVCIFGKFFQLVRNEAILQFKRFVRLCVKRIDKSIPSIKQDSHRV